MSTALVSAAEISNLFSVLTVLLALLGMVIFILRLHGEDIMLSSAVVRPNRTPQPVSMVTVQNPFALRLQKLSHCSLKGVYCTISSQVPFTLQAFWGVGISDLHKILTTDKTIFVNLFYEDSLLNGSVVSKGAQKSFDRCVDLDEHLEPNCDLNVELGSPPRTKYPLVIIMTRKEFDENDNQRTVIAMINVIHIKDEVCKMESSVLMQYLKQTTGQISCLQPLYVANDDSNSPNDCEMDHVCVVCQSESVTRALLPCRHTCVCANCFSQIDKCPMCRSPIQSYFCIKDEPTRMTNSEDNFNELNWRQKLEILMMRLNNYLGFT